MVEIVGPGQALEHETEAGLVRHGIEGAAGTGAVADPQRRVAGLDQRLLGTVHLRTSLRSGRPGPDATMPATGAGINGGAGWCGPSGRQHVDELAAASLAELHRALDQGEQRVVAARADVLAGVDAGAALAHDDRAGVHRLAVEPP